MGYTFYQLNKLGTNADDSYDGGTTELIEPTSGHNPGGWTWSAFYATEADYSKSEDVSAFYEFAWNGILGLVKYTDDDSGLRNWYTSGINSNYGNYIYYAQADESGDSGDSSGKGDIEVEYGEAELGGLKERYGYMEEDYFYDNSDGVESGALHNKVTDVISEILATLYVNKYSFKQTPPVPFEDDMVDVFGIEEVEQQIKTGFVKTKEVT
tara:strand:+ start:1353 stop:1985 length:633 start_codon:yes stop_codon:yes gene_type:complete